MTEKDLTRQFTDYLTILENRGILWFWRDNHSQWNKAGFPDLMVWLAKDHRKINSPECLHIELKTEKGRLSKDQIKWESWIQSHTLHTEYIVMRSIEALEDKLDEYLKDFVRMLK